MKNSDLDITLNLKNYEEKKNLKKTKLIISKEPTVKIDESSTVKTEAKATGIIFSMC